MNVEINATTYTCSMLPEGNVERGTWALTIEYVGSRDPDNPLRWAVRSRMGCCFNRDGELDYEPTPSSRTDEWIAANRFTLEEAKELALREVPKIVINGLTAADVLRIQAERRTV